MIQTTIHPHAKVALAVSAGVLLLFVFKYYNPYEVDFYPQCPVHTYTGYKCSGCGAQRAVHHLLNLRVADAFRENALLVLSLPYLAVAVGFSVFHQWRHRYATLHRRLFGPRTLLLVAVVVVLFGVLRNF